MIAVIDYGVGTLFSLCRSLEAVGQTPVVTGDPAVLRRADKLFLPGVGAFADAAEKLRRTGLDRVIREEAEKRGAGPGMDPLAAACEKYKQKKGYGGKQI